MTSRESNVSKIFLYEHIHIGRYGVWWWEDGNSHPSAPSPQPDSQTHARTIFFRAARGASGSREGVEADADGCHRHQQPAAAGLGLVKGDGRTKARGLNTGVKSAPR